MLSIIKSIALNGIDGVSVDVQVDVSNGIPKWEIVGLPDASVRESKERVRMAIKNSGYELPGKKIIVNLAPATIKKEGTSFDLSIALAIISANGNVNRRKMSETLFIGELGLDGNLISINGMLPICIEAQRMGFKRIVVPDGNKKEASVVKNLEVIPAKSLKSVVDYLNGIINICSEKNDYSENICSTYAYDFSDVKGQKNVKRALEIAASGGHNCLMIGSPGSGKTMMARRFQTILPDLNLAESIEVTKIHSIAGKLNNDNPLIVNRPFVEPHYSISKIAMIGGYNNLKPGEISLAHRGILFLDELPEFNRNVLDALRGPIESGEVSIARCGTSICYPCKFTLIASMNPCPCGYYGSDRACRCTEKSIKNYLNRVSGPLLDRIDIQVEVSRIKYTNIKGDVCEESSNAIRARVIKAWEIQKKRYANEGILVNSELNSLQIKKYCKLNARCEQILEKYFDKLKMSARAYEKIIKIARTIADMDESADIEEPHLLEAIQYRNLDRKFF